MWVDKDGRPYQGGGVVIDKKRYWFPTDEQFIEAGYHWYVPPAPEPPDMTAFNAACAQFRALCAQIEQAAGLPGFKGGFDEMIDFQQTPIYSTIPGLQLAMAWSAANELCKYEGEKVGFGQPVWWYECWSQVEPEPTPEEPLDGEGAEEGSPVEPGVSNNTGETQPGQQSSENSVETPVEEPVVVEDNSGATASSEVVEQNDASAPANTPDTGASASVDNGGSMQPAEAPVNEQPSQSVVSGENLTNGTEGVDS